MLLEETLSACTTIDKLNEQELQALHHLPSEVVACSNIDDLVNWVATRCWHIQLAICVVAPAYHCVASTQRTARVAKSRTLLSSRIRDL
jgi:hypothetical protein